MTKTGVMICGHGSRSQSASGVEQVHIQIIGRILPLDSELQFRASTGHRYMNAHALRGGNFPLTHSLHLRMPVAQHRGLFGAGAGVAGRGLRGHAGACVADQQTGKQPAGCREVAHRRPGRPDSIPSLAEGHAQDMPWAGLTHK